MAKKHPPRFPPQAPHLRLAYAAAWWVDIKDLYDIVMWSVNWVDPDFGVGELPISTCVVQQVFAQRAESEGAYPFMSETERYYADAENRIMENRLRFQKEDVKFLEGL